MTVQFMDTTEEKKAKKNMLVKELAQNLYERYHTGQDVPRWHEAPKSIRKEFLQEAKQEVQFMI